MSDELPTDFVDTSVTSPVQEPVEEPELLADTETTEAESVEPGTLAEPRGEYPGIDVPEQESRQGYRSDAEERRERGFRGDRDRGGRGASGGPERVEEWRDGSDLAPPLPADINPRDLAREIRDELRSLKSTDANRVAGHLVATARLLDDEPEVALAHARAARRLAPRIAAVREALGLAAYRNGEWQAAIAELRTYHRLTGRQTHLAVIADSERALGRPERAIDIYRTADRSKLAPDEAAELLIVAAAARGDLGQREAAVSMLQVRELTAPSREPWVARLRYAYAESLLAVGRRDEARSWFARAADIDDDLATDAAERLLELDGVVLDDEDLDAMFDEDAEPDEAERQTVGNEADIVDAAETADEAETEVATEADTEDDDEDEDETEHEVRADERGQDRREDDNQ